MHTHLRDREHDDRNRDRRLPDQIGARDEERGRREHDRERETDEIAEHTLLEADVFLIAGGHIGSMMQFDVAHVALPSRETTENTATQMMSSACQNSAKQSRRRRMSARKPLAKTCAIMVSSHKMPAETCRP